MLDGGVHVVGALRTLLGPSHPPVSVSAITLQQNEHLKPIDHVYSVWSTKTGIGGSFCLSSGTTLQGRDFYIACEKGRVLVRDGSTVVVHAPDGTIISSQTFPIIGLGIDPEVQCWADGLLSGNLDPRFDPGEAFIDLYVMEKILQSGCEGGTKKTLEYLLPTSPGNMVDSTV